MLQETVFLQFTISHSKSTTMSNKRKRIIEDTEEDEQPDSKKQKIEDEREALTSLRTYDISEIKEIIKKNNKLENLDIVEIESGFTLIRPDYLIIKLDENKKFVVTKRQVNELHLKLSKPISYEEFCATNRLKVFVTGDDVDLEGVDDPNDTSHSMFVGTFSVLFGGSMPKNDFILWFQGSRKSLSSAALDKLGNHVVDPNKKEKKPIDALPADQNGLMRKARDYIAHLTKILPTLPNLPAPDPYPGTWEQALEHIALSLRGDQICGTAHTWDLTPVGRALMKEDSPVTNVDIVCFETAHDGQTVLLGGATHSPKVERLCISSMLMRGDSSSYSKHYGKVLATSKTLKTLALHRIHHLDIDSLFAGLNECASLETLVLEYCGLTDADFEKLVAVICNPSSKMKLRVLNFQGNQITEAAAPWVQFLLEHSSLEAISLFEIESMKEEFGSYLGRGLAKNKKLKRIYFTKTKLGAKGVMSMLQEITGVNETLERIDFEMCKLGKQGGDALVDFLSRNSSIQYLNLCSTGIGEKTWPKLLKVIESKTNITGFTINKCDERVGDISVVDLIERSPRLKDIRGQNTNDPNWTRDEFRR